MACVRNGALMGCAGSRCSLRALCLQLHHLAQVSALQSMEGGHRCDGQHYDDNHGADDEQLVCAGVGGHSLRHEVGCGGDGEAHGDVAEDDGLFGSMIMDQNEPPDINSCVSALSQIC